MMFGRQTPAASSELGECTRLGREIHTQLATCYIANISWAPDEQQLAFERRDGVWTIHIDGTGLTHLAGGGQPAWAPDGKHIAFIASGQVVVAAPDGSGAKTISDAAAAEPITWAPDGSRLAYIHSSRAIKIARADGAFTHYAAHTRPVALAWSPDSRRLAYAAGGRSVGDKTIVDDGVWRITPDATTLAAQTRIPLEPTKWPGAGQAPPRGGLSWAPSGKWLMVSEAGACRDRLGIYRLDAQARRPRSA